MVNEEIFTREFLIALSKWQKGWYENQDTRRVLADELVKQCKDLPIKFKTSNGPCYRKRFLIEGEISPILADDKFFEGIASWSTNIEYAKGFKGWIKKSNTKFIMVFKHEPSPKEIVVNIVSLWEDEQFKLAVEKFYLENKEDAEALIHFRDTQHEIVLRSTLKGSEIEDIITISKSFEELCDMANIPNEKRKELSIRYEKNPNGIPIELPTFAGKKSTKSAVKKVLGILKKMIKDEEAGNLIIDWSKAAKPHNEDIKHELKE